MLAQLRRTVSSIRAPNAREVLSLPTTPSFASYWLIPRLHSFTQANPGVDVRLDASYEVRDLQAEGFDSRCATRAPNAGEGEPPVQRIDAAGVCAVLRRSKSHR